MTFQEAESTYKDLRAKYAGGKISSADFEAEVSKLKLQDAEGRWWQIGVQSGDWYVHDGQKWTKSQPPAPEKAEKADKVDKVTPSLPEVPAAAPKPFPPGSRSKGLPARLLSAAPARSRGRMPLPLLIGIVVLAALVGAGILYAGYSFFSGQFNSSGGPIAQATETPTVSLAGLISTTVIPTLPVQPPTDTPEPVTEAPTSTATATLPLPTATVAVTATVAGVTPTPRPTGPTPTRRPSVTPTPTVTKGPSVPPGVYVTKLQTDPAQPSIGEPIQFRVSFLNTTGKLGPGTWYVKIFKCVAACTADELRVNRSIGETPKTNKQILPGGSDLVVGPWSAGTGACTYVASPFYYDSSQNVVPFVKPDGSQLYQLVNVCH